MTRTDHDPRIPDDLAAALRSAAAHVPDADLHPSTPQLRLRTRRRRRRTLTAGAAAAAVLVTVGVAALARPEPGGDVVANQPGGGDPTDASAADGRQGQAESPPVLMPTVGAEMLADGETRELPRAQPDDLLHGAVRLDDGRLVTLSSRDLAPGRPREDGAFVEDVAFVLAVFDAQNQLLVERDVREPRGRVTLGGQHDGSIVLLRQTALDNCCTVARGVDVSAVDPDDLTETELTTVDTWVTQADAVAGRLVLAHDGTAEADGRVRQASCTLDVVDLATSQTRQVELPGCTTVYDLSVSPDGQRVAVVTDSVPAQGDGPLSLWLNVIGLSDDADPSDGTTVADSVRLDRPEDCAAPDIPMCALPELRGITWIDAESWFVLVQDPAPRRGANGEVVVSGELVTDRLRGVSPEG